MAGSTNGAAAGDGSTGDVTKVESNHVHQYSEGDIVKEATCTSEGYKLKKCSSCGAEELEHIAIDPEAHNWVKSEHKDATERVAAMAKAADKEKGVRTRWTKFIQAGQSFDTFVTRECAYFGMTTKGNRVAEKNGELACRINYYRMRTNVLKNRFLSAAKR